MPPTLYYDLGSPYAYLAFERIPRPIVLQPILLGAIFALRGHGSWSQTDQREARMTEVEERARRYGLPPLVWPPGWPANGLAAMRVATWAPTEAFARAVFRREFTAGADIASMDVLAACAREAGLDPAAMTRALDDPAIKRRLKDATQAAWDAGVRGVPTVRAGDALFYGDDRLEDASRP